MKKILSALLVLSLVSHYPSLSAEESNGRVFKSHSLLPTSKVRTFWFIPNTQTGTMAYTYPCGLDCVDNKIISLMPDINVVVYSLCAARIHIGLILKLAAIMYYQVINQNSMRMVTMNAMIIRKKILWFMILIMAE